MAGAPESGHVLRLQAVAEAHHGQAADDDPGSDRLGRDQAAHPVERRRDARHRGERGHCAHAPAEQPDGHAGGAGAGPRVGQRAGDVPPLGDPVLSRPWQRLNQPPDLRLLRGQLRKCAVVLRIPGRNLAPQDGYKTRPRRDPK